MTSTIPPKQRMLPAGVYTPLISLFDDSPRQNLDLDAMYKHCQHVVKSGMHGLVYQGTNGEAVLLSEAERQQAISNARRAVNDLGFNDDFPIVAGITGESTNQSIRFAEQAADAGANFALLLPASYWKGSVDDSVIISFYKEVADASPLPVVIYNFPGVTNGIDLNSDHISELAEHPNIVAVKLTCGNVGKMARLCSKFRPDQFSVFGGSSDYLVPTLEIGGMGCVTGMGNVFPAATAGLYEVWKAGRREEARALPYTVANAEWACKKSLALTKYGAYYFAGKRLGLKLFNFSPRKPYLPCKETQQQWTVKTMEVLAEDEASIYQTKNSSKTTNGVNGVHSANGVNGAHGVNGVNGAKKQVLSASKADSSVTGKIFQLNTGARIPALGYGTWQASEGEAGRGVEMALKTGYRHIDCAPLYWNEKEIGNVFAKTSIPRSELFITTKLWSSQHNQAEAALRKSLADLQLDYVDLYLMHWPVSLPPNDASASNFGKEDRKVHSKDWDFTDTWRDMEKLLETGLTRAIGVANFSTVNLEKLLKTAKVVPAVNQTEIHPLLPQDKLNAYCRSKGIHQTAFGPLGGKGSTLHTHNTILDIAKKRQVGTAQVLLSWGIKHGWSVIPKTVTPERIESNFQVFDMSEAEAKQIDELAKTEGRRFNRPDWGCVVFHDDEGLGLL